MDFARCAQAQNAPEAAPPPQPPTAANADPPRGPGTLWRATEHMNPAAFTPEAVTANLLTLYQMQPVPLAAAYGGMTQELISHGNSHNTGAPMFLCSLQGKLQLGYALLRVPEASKAALATNARQRTKQWLVCVGHRSGTDEAHEPVSSVSRGRRF